MSIYQHAQNVTKRFLTFWSKIPLSETNKKDQKPKIINTIITSVINKVTAFDKKNKNREKKSNMKGTTSEEQTCFVQAIQKCWDEKSQKFKNLYNIILFSTVLYKECQVKKCKNDDIQIHHVRALYKKLTRNYATISMKSTKKKKIKIRYIESALRRKQISLCKKHHLDIYTRQLTHFDIKNTLKSIKLLNKNNLEINF